MCNIALAHMYIEIYLFILICSCSYWFHYMYYLCLFYLKHQHTWGWQIHSLFDKVLYFLEGSSLSVCARCCVWNGIAHCALTGYPYSISNGPKFVLPLALWNYSVQLIWTLQDFGSWEFTQPIFWCQNHTNIFFMH